jgi:2-polyprenyl-6-methoxyphenol hydroxylase-like FAD-dependent oxidoreductase
LSAGIARRSALSYGAVWTNVSWPANGPFALNALEQRYRAARHMCGVLPIGRQSASHTPEAAFFWSLKRSDVDAWRAEGIEKWKADVEALWPETADMLAQLTSLEQLTFAQYDHYTAAQPWGERIVHIGDAAHATSPQLGQGANMALLDAFALDVALRERIPLQSALARYARMRRWHIRLFQWASAWFTPFYQSDSIWLPWLRDWIAAPVSRMPVGKSVLARLVSGMTTAPIAGIALDDAARNLGVSAAVEARIRSDG